jgi:hypothetical protein
MTTSVYDFALKKSHEDFTRDSVLDLDTLITPAAPLRTSSLFLGGSVETICSLKVRHPRTIFLV